MTISEKVFGGSLVRIGERLKPCQPAGEYQFTLTCLIVSLFLLMLTVSAVSWADDKTIVPKEVQRLTVKGYVNAVAWNADGSRLAALSEEGSTVTLWETKHWSKLNEFKRISNAYMFNSLAFLPDGTLLTANPGGYDKQPHDDAYLTDPKHNGENIWVLGKFALIQWDPMTGTPLHYFPNVKHLSDIPEHVGITDTYTVSKDGSLVAGINGFGVVLFDAKGNLLRQIDIPQTPQHKDFTQSVALSWDGSELAVGALSGKLYFYNVSSGVLTHTITAFTTRDYSWNALGYSPDRKYIAAGKYKNHNVAEPNDLSTYIWRLSDGKLIAALPGTIEPAPGHKEEATMVRTLAWGPNVLAVGDDKSLRLWHINETSQTLLLDKRMDHGTFDINFSPSGAFAATDNNQIVIYQ